MKKYHWTPYVNKEESKIDNMFLRFNFNIVIIELYTRTIDHWGVVFVISLCTSVGKNDNERRYFSTTHAHTSTGTGAHTQSKYRNVQKQLPSFSFILSLKDI